MRLTTLFCLSLLPVHLANAAWEVKETAGQHVDVLQDGTLRARWMTAYDTSTPQRLNETYKPFLHVYDAAGKAPITKGPGGEYTHHRGIFIGWSGIKSNGKSYDRWHMKGGAQVCTGIVSPTADAEGASFIAKVDWNDEAGKPFLTERRTFTFRPGPAGGYLLVDMASELTAVSAAVTLGGDPEHAGCHFRPAGDILKDKTAYLYPREKADPHKDRDYPWAAEQFTLPGGTYAVAHLNHPGNPTGTAYSAYRNYGRFGAFATATLQPGEPCTFRYRFWIREGELPAAADIQAAWNAFSGRDEATPAVTRKAAEGVKP